ncbi:MAG: vWA domain-containing protein [Pseudomonadota bacterium]
MKTKILAIGLFLLTLSAITYYPKLMATTLPHDLPVEGVHAPQSPRIDAVFVLDTTGSMGGLIQTAKEKIWSIATTMASARQTPELRIGLVAYRDRGDAYITKTIDLSDDLDSVYATLMDFEADGGGDSPESVNEALYKAVHNMSWSQQDDAYQVIFLVGDAPPHMDYDEPQYPEIIASAIDKGIVINTIQCGTMPTTAQPWTQIAALSQGRFFQVEQAGGAVAFTTPFDEQIATLSAELDSTRLYFGSAEEKEKMHSKMAATDRLNAESSVAARARRGSFNASSGGRTNLLGENELVSAVADGTVDLDDLSDKELPAPMVEMAPAEQKAFVAELAEKRRELQGRIRELSEERNAYLTERVEEAGGLEDSLDRQVFSAVQEQADKVGLEYDEGPKY